MADIRNPLIHPRSLGPGTAAKVSSVAIIAILGAIGGILSTFNGHPFIALLVHVFCLLCGVAGLAMSASPRVRGGMISILAIVLCVVGLVIDLLVGVFKIITF